MTASLLVATAIMGPSVSASTDATSAEAIFAFSTAALPGDVTISSVSTSEIRVPGGQGTFSWRLSAASATVNWTKDTWLEVGRPTNLSEPLGSARLESTAGEAEFQNAVIESVKPDGGANLFVRSQEHGNLALHGVLRDGELRHTSVGSRVGGAVGDYAPMEVEYDVVARSIDGRAGGGNVSAQGNMTLLVWGTEVFVTGPDGRQTFQSGHWVNGVGPAPPREPHAVRESNYQLVRIDVDDAILEIKSDGHELGWMSRKATAVGNQTAVMEDASGTADQAGQGPEYESTRLKVAGPYRIAMWSAAGDPPTLKANWLAASSVEGVPDSTASRQGDDGVPNPVAALTAGSGVAGWILPMLGALAFMAGILVLRSRRRVSVDDVEWALLSGRARKAGRLGARLLRKRRTDADAIFLYGAALLARRKHGAVLRALEPLAEGIPRRRRRGIAYVLMTAATAQGELNKAKRWAAEAAEDPGLRRKMEDNGLLVRMGFARPELAGYA